MTLQCFVRHLKAAGGGRKTVRVLQISKRCCKAMRSVARHRTASEGTDKACTHGHSKVISHPLQVPSRELSNQTLSGVLQTCRLGRRRSVCWFNRSVDKDDLYKGMIVSIRRNFCLAFKKRDHMSWY